MNNKHSDFEQLSPERILCLVEEALHVRLTGLTMPLPSYINRVYELQDFSGNRLIAKFYRPGRWSREALLEEHAFLADCVADEIPVVAPMELPDGGTLAGSDGLYFAVFPKRAGREFEIITDDDWLRIGRIVGRVHQAGSRCSAEHRLILHPEHSTRDDLALLQGGDFISPVYRAAFADLTAHILEDITPLFAGTRMSRIHGDCHRGNILERPGEGLMLIDFDDMVTGPPVHDLWLLLPDHYGRCRREMGLILEGYEEFCSFDYGQLRIIEPLRFMRIIYYLAWCARQVDDYQFRSNHPDWGSERFWEREILDLRHQYQVIMEHKVQWEEEHGIVFDSEF